MVMESSTPVRLFAVPVVAALSTVTLAGVATADPTPSEKAADKPITTLIGSGQKDPDPKDERDNVPPLEVNLDNPRSVEVAKDGTVYVADTHNGKIRALGPEREEMRTVAGIVNALLPPGTDNGDGGKATKAILYQPRALALDPTGRRLYFLDGAFGQVRVIDLRRGTIETVPGADDDLHDPSDLVMDRKGSLYVADRGVCELDLDGDGCRTVSKIDATTLAVGPDDTVYVADTHKARISAIDPETGDATPVAGTGDSYGDLGEGGAATAASLGLVRGIDVSRDGILYLTDFFNNRVRAVDLDSGVITTAAGIGRNTRHGKESGSGFAGDGGPAGEAELSWPIDVAAGADGTLYIVDNGNARIRMVGGTSNAGDDTGRDESEGGGGGAQSNIYLIGLLVSLAAMIVAGIVLLRPGRHKPGSATSGAPPTVGQPWPAAGHQQAQSSGGQPGTATDEPGEPPAESSHPAGRKHPAAPATIWSTRRFRLVIVGLACAVVPFFTSFGIESSEELNGVLISYSYFDVLGLGAGIAAIGIAVRLARRTTGVERLAVWRLAAVVLALVAVLQIMHATEVVKLVSPCTSMRPDNSWCRYER